MRAIHGIIALVGVLGFLVMPAWAGGSAPNTVTMANGTCEQTAPGEFEFGSPSHVCCEWLEGKLAAKKGLLTKLTQQAKADDDRIEALTTEIRVLETKIHLKKRRQALSPADFFYGHLAISASFCNCSR